MKKLIFLLLFVFLLFPLCAAAGLRWSSSAGGKKFTEALIYCSNLKENGVSGWRLPTTDELSAFNESSGYYWASDTADDLNREKQYANDEDKAWYYDFSAKKKDKSLVSARLRVVCVKNAAAKPKFDKRDREACGFARKDQSLTTWKMYLENFPKGECAFEAKAEIEKLEIKEAEKRREEERIAKERAEKERAEKERIEREQRELDEKRDLEKRTVGTLQYSKRAARQMSWYDAMDYCLNLKENGLSGWRLPDLSELIILRLHASQSRFGDAGWFWSSQEDSADPGRAFELKFDDAAGADSGSKDDKDFVRCIRDIK